MLKKRGCMEKMNFEEAVFCHRRMVPKTEKGAETVRNSICTGR